MPNKDFIDGWRKIIQGDLEERKTNADWTCKECKFEWKEENPFITPGNCISCGSDYIQHY